MFALSSACGVGSRIQCEEPGLPLLDRQAQLGIARHHVARAQREAERVERGVDVAREREQPRALPRRPSRVVGGGEHAARCPGRWRTSARRGPRCPAPASTSRCRRASCRVEHELDRPARQRVVERGDRARQRLGAHALREQVLREPADVVAGALQRRRSRRPRAAPRCTCRIDTRCSAKRSRSLTTPSEPAARRRRRSGGSPRSAITCIASYAVADAGQRDERRRSSPRPAASSAGAPAARRAAAGRPA